MAREAKFLACFAIVAIHLCAVKCSPEIMEKLSMGFSKAFSACQAELNIHDDIMKDLKNYWDEKYELLNRDFGCIIRCMSKKLDLLDADGKLHHGNAKEFATAHGADEETAQKLIDIVHDCEKQNAGVDDACTMVLEIAKCFRTKMHELKWAPSMEIIIDEVLAEI